jgi:hypothetical protein
MTSYGKGPALQVLFFGAAGGKGFPFTTQALQNRRMNNFIIWFGWVLISQNSIPPSSG